MTGTYNLGDSYDAGGRRDAESFYPYYGGLGSPCGTIPCTETLNFLHDGSSIAGWQSSLTGYQYQAVTGQWDFLKAGSATLAGSYTDAASQTTTNYVPLMDAAGTVIALVNPASASSPAETVTYDPSGTPSASGSANGCPFLYHGMEHEVVEPTQFYYSGGGQFYSAQIMRSMSMAGAQGTSGPGSSLSGGPGSLSSLGSSGAELASPANIAGSIATGDAAALGALFAIGAGAEGGSGGSLTPVVIVYFAGIGLYDLFDLAFGGGSPDYPPNYWTFQFRATRAGRHPLYDQVIGIAPELAPSQASANGGLPTRDEDIEPSSGATVALVGALEIAADAEAVGGGPEDPVADVVAVASIAVGGAIAGYEAFQFYAKGGKQKIRDTGLAGLPDSEIVRRAHEPSIPPQERRRYQREEKARKQRNKRKRR